MEIYFPFFPLVLLVRCLHYILCDGPTVPLDGSFGSVTLIFTPPVIFLNNSIYEKTLRINKRL